MLCSATAAADPFRAAHHIDRDWLLSSLQRDIVGHMPDRAVLSNGFVRTDVGDGWSLPAATPTRPGLQIAQGRTGYVTGMAWQHLQGVISQSKLDAIGNASARVSDFILAHGRTNAGGYYWGFNHDGSIPQNNHYDKYDANYAIGIAGVGMAMANAYRVTGEATYWEGAKHAWSVIDQRMRDGWGNPIAAMDRGFTGVLETRQETRPNMNHLMHTLETLQEMYKYAPAPDKAAIAADLADWTGFLMDHCYTPRSGHSGHGFFSDIFEVDDQGHWVVPADGYVNPGHSVETSFFVSRAVELLQAEGRITRGTAQQWLEKAGKVVDYCLDTALQPFSYSGGQVSLLYSEADFDGHVIGSSADSWAQAELLRAVAHWAAIRGGTAGYSEDQLWQIFDDTWFFATGELPSQGISGGIAHLMDMADGGWAGFSEDGQSTKNRLTSWGGSYHEGMLYDELLRLEMIPEPTTALLLAPALGLSLMRRRRTAVGAQPASSFACPSSAARPSPAGGVGSGAGVSLRRNVRSNQFGG